MNSGAPTTHPWPIHRPMPSRVAPRRRAWIDQFQIDPRAAKNFNGNRLLDLWHGILPGALLGDAAHFFTVLR